MFLLCCFLLLTTATSQGYQEVGTVKEYCQKETFQPRCSNGEVILMKSAAYGRMREGRCVIVEQEEENMITNARYLGCWANVINVLDTRCSGKAFCEVAVLDDELQRLNPCFKGLVSYMETSYSCVPASESSNCHISTRSNTAIYIPSTSIGYHRCGTHNRPIIVEAPVGQKVNVEFVNLNGSLLNVFCPFTFGYVQERKSKDKKEFCIDNTVRHKDLYTSQQNRIEISLETDRIHLLNSNKTHETFFISIQAVGCSDLLPAEDAWLKRNNDDLTIGCYSSRQTWRLKCLDNQWVGVVGNCSSKHSPNIKSHEDNLNVSKDKDLELIGIIAITGIGLAVCGLIAGMGYLCSRRYTSEKSKMPEFKDRCQNIPDGEINYYNKQLLQTEDRVDDNSYGPNAYFVLDEAALSSENKLDNTLK